MSSVDDGKPPVTVSAIAKSLFAGGVAGGLSRTAVAPLERLKILMQVQGNTGRVYTGVWQGLVYMARSEGFRGMMKGNGTNCARIIPNSAVKFFAYEHMSSALMKMSPDGQINPLTRLAAGAGAGIIAMSATYPLDMVRGRLTVQEGSGMYNGMWHATRMIVKEEGVKALYKGWVPSVIGVVPYVGLNFAVYGTMKDVMIAQYGVKSERDLSVITKLGCGAVAGTIGQTVAYPFDVARRRLQMVGMKEAAASTISHTHIEGPMNYTGMMDCFMKTVRYEGFGALFKGLMPNYVKVVPSIAIAFVTYEKLKEWMHVEVYISSS
mmetsp:Transcript_40431/g.72625  ORF Transcript_40431/g.72625 Transcript_40431/m.72625 type:complete len:322 (-) Transcript_40431:172-1137(-)|eukprot:CAMPEP_0177771874 /NCGR_PEP_ID=MMETSP0491_2-20121128/11876_1 /TAXON_ID=63592 /ORGANISM="Tetraselmis chuii, Strain PLY429" /LENGTH=321 /DNA_ID=CAMNT_0019289555 /DNA_START=179 /DNA_END=1144 /DNA_ORIENTATION=-